tara:strand:+ start:321 stop:632 length:312 start_codon:yes stop_codon:yes gene_type:complete
MTKTELEQVRAALTHGHEFGLHVRHAACDKALAILNAELAKPEAREWRASMSGFKIGDPPGRVYSDHEEFSAMVSGWTEGNAPHHFKLLMESRTPAGPWERAE